MYAYCEYSANKLIYAPDEQTELMTKRLTTNIDDSILKMKIILWNRTEPKWNEIQLASRWCARIFPTHTQSPLIHCNFGRIYSSSHHRPFNCFIFVECILQSHTHAHSHTHDAVNFVTNPMPIPISEILLSLSHHFNQFAFIYLAEFDSFLHIIIILIKSTDKTTTTTTTLSSLLNASNVKDESRIDKLMPHTTIKIHQIQLSLCVVSFSLVFAHQFSLSWFCAMKTMTVSERLGATSDAYIEIAIPPKIYTSIRSDYCHRFWEARARACNKINCSLRFIELIKHIKSVYRTSMLAANSENWFDGLKDPKEWRNECKLMLWTAKSIVCGWRNVFLFYVFSQRSTAVVFRLLALQIHICWPFSIVHIRWDNCSTPYPSFQYHSMSYQSSKND